MRRPRCSCSKIQREMPLLRDLFELSDAEVALFDHVRKHDGWTSAYLRLPGQTGGLMRLVPDAFTRWLVSQDDRDRVPAGSRRSTRPAAISVQAVHGPAPHGQGPGRRACVIRDPSCGCCIVQGLLLLALLGWWCGLTPAERLARLGVVLVGRARAPRRPQTRSWPRPPGCLPPPAAPHRHGGLLGVAALVGHGEGIARRRQDVLGGFLLRWWTIGGAGSRCSLGARRGISWRPGRCQRLGVASGLARLVALGMYALACGTAHTCHERQRMKRWC